MTRLCIAAPKHGWYLWLYLLANLMTVEFGITISTDDLAGSDTRITAFWALDQKMVKIKTMDNQRRSKESPRSQRPCGWSVKEQVCKCYLEVFQSGTLQSSCSHSNLEFWKSQNPNLIRIMANQGKKLVKNKDLVGIVISRSVSRTDK